MTSPTIQREAAYPGCAMLRNGDVEVIAAPAPSPETLAYISEQVTGAAEYRRLNLHAQGMGYPSASDVLSAQAKCLAATPAAYVRAEVFAGLDNPRNDGISATLFKADVGACVSLYTAPPASSDLLTAAKALATRYLKAQHDDASLCVNAAHHKAVCDLFAEIERAGKGGAK